MLLQCIGFRKLTSVLLNSPTILEMSVNRKPNSPPEEEDYVESSSFIKRMFSSFVPLAPSKKELSGVEKQTLPLKRRTIR